MGNMSEHERMLREWIRATPGGPLSHELATQALDAALSATRDAALEEAAQQAHDAIRNESNDIGISDGQAVVLARRVIDVLRALKPNPAERYLPESMVREVLATYAENDNTGVVAAIAASLGLDLDAKGEAP